MLTDEEYQAIESRHMEEVGCHICPVSVSPAQADRAALLRYTKGLRREIARLREQLEAERNNPFKPDSPVYGPIKR